MLVAIKAMLMQHCRRLLISANLFEYFLFMKTHIQDSDYLFSHLCFPLDEIFINPDCSYDNKFFANRIICDIHVSYLDFYNDESQDGIYLEKYKETVSQLIISNSNVSGSAGSLLSDKIINEN